MFEGDTVQPQLATYQSDSLDLGASFAAASLAVSGYVGALIESLNLGTVTIASANVTLTNTSTSVTVTSTAGLAAGMSVTGTGIPAGATIASVSSSTVFVLSAAATTSTSAGNYVFNNVYTHTAQTSPDNSTWTNAGTATAIAAMGINYASISIPAGTQYVRRSVTIAGYLPSISGKSWLDVGGEPGKDMVNPLAPQSGGAY